jgi:hypothetical protein
VRFWCCCEVSFLPIRDAGHLRSMDANANGCDVMNARNIGTTGRRFIRTATGVFSAYALPQFRSCYHGGNLETRTGVGADTQKGISRLKLQQQARTYNPFTIHPNGRLHNGVPTNLDTHRVAQSQGHRFRYYPAQRVGNRLVITYDDARGASKDEGETFILICTYRHNGSRRKLPRRRHHLPCCYGTHYEPCLTGCQYENGRNFTRLASRSEATTTVQGAVEMFRRPL